VPKTSRNSKPRNFFVGVVVALVLIVSWFSLPNSKRVTPKPYVEFVATVQDPRCFSDNGADTTEPFWFGFCTGYNLGSSLAGNSWFGPVIDEFLTDVGALSATKDFYRKACSAIYFVKFNDSGRDFTSAEDNESKKACQQGMIRGYKIELARLIRDDAPAAYMGVNPPKPAADNIPQDVPVKPKISPTRKPPSGGMEQKCVTVQVPNPNYSGRIESDANGNIVPPTFPERRCTWIQR
jgi:hypothetical protein